jgi:hypothetical protein
VTRPSAVEPDLDAAIDAGVQALPADLAARLFSRAVFKTPAIPTQAAIVQDVLKFELIRYCTFVPGLLRLCGCSWLDRSGALLLSFWNEGVPTVTRTKE